MIKEMRRRILHPGEFGASTSHKKKILCLLWRKLALDDLYVVELHIEVARVNLLVLFQVRQTHSG